MAHEDTIRRDHVLVITRDLPAPPERVFEVFTQPDHLVHWWGPKDFQADQLAFDVRPGGRYRARIFSEGYGELWMQGVYREVKPPHRLVFTFAWDRENDELNFETLITATFEPSDTGTRFTFRQEPFPSENSRDSHHRGWSECFDRLAVYVGAPEENERTT